MELSIFLFVTSKNVPTVQSTTSLQGPQPMCSTPLQTGATELLNPTRTAEVSPTIQSLRESEENLRKLIVSTVVDVCLTAPSCSPPHM